TRGPAGCFRACQRESNPARRFEQTGRLQALWTWSLRGRRHCDREHKQNKTRTDHGTTLRSFGVRKLVCALLAAACCRAANGRFSNVVTRNGAVENGAKTDKG